MSLLSPSTKRRIALGLLGTLLLVLLGSANVLVAANRTVLDADHVVDTFEEEDAHVAMAESLREDFEADAGGADGGGGSGSDGGDGSTGGIDDVSAPSVPDPPVEELLEDAVTPDYVLSQVDGVVHDLYAYLHGETDDFAPTVRTVPVKDAVAEGVEEWVLELDLAELDPGVGELAESEQQYEATREAFEEAQLERIQEETDEEYTEEELRQIYDRARDDIRAGLVDELESQVADSGAPPALHEPMVAFGTVRIDGLIDPDLTYDQYVADAEAARADLASALGTVVRSEMDEEVPDEEAFEGLSEEDREDLEPVRTAFSLASTLVYVLPLGALVVAALYGWIAPARSAALRGIGGATAVVGLSGLVGSFASRRVLPSDLGGPEEAAPMEDVVLALLESAVGAVGVQGGVLLVLGLGLVGAGVAVSRGMVPIEDVPGGGEAAGPGAAGGGADTAGGSSGEGAPDGVVDGGGVVPSADGDGASPGDDGASPGNDAASAGDDAASGSGADGTAGTGAGDADGGADGESDDAGGS